MMRTFRFSKWFLLAFLAFALPVASHAQVAVGVSIRIGPPPLRVYAQPICPGVGYIWTPGFWAYGDDGYYWVPGTWILAPRPGFLWTPGYWGFGGGFYVWHVGYWGPHVGFYGGINYGFGYGGVGFWGGEWRGRNFYYNRSVTNINVNIHNTYNRTVIVNNNSHVAFNGEGGVRAEPTREEMAAAHEEHIQPTQQQMSHREEAQNNRANHFDAARDNRENGRNFEHANNGNHNGERGNGNRGGERANQSEKGNRNNRQMNDRHAARNQNGHPNKDERKPHGEHPHR